MLDWALEAQEKVGLRPMTKQDHNRTTVLPIENVYISKECMTNKGPTSLQKMSTDLRPSEGLILVPHDPIKNNFSGKLCTKSTFKS